MSTDCICFNRPGWDKECPVHKSRMGYPTTDPLRNAYGEIMYWADLRLSQQHHAQQCCETCDLIHQSSDPSDVHAATCCFMAEELMMAAQLVAKQGGFEKEYWQHREQLFSRYWGEGLNLCEPSP